MWLVPSKGRPYYAQRLFEAAQFKEPGVLILDAAEEIEYRSVKIPAGWKRMALMAPVFLSDKLNRTYAKFPNEPWYGILNDDHLPKTEGWERAIIDAAGNGIAWPHDNYAKRISCHVKGGELVRKLGWFVCPRMKHFWLDDADELIAAEIGGKFLPDVMVSHEHVNAGRMKADRTYMQRPSNGADRAAFERWRKEEWPDVQERISELRRAA